MEFVKKLAKDNKIIRDVPMTELTDFFLQFLGGSNEQE
jgi:chromatin segregation and condensation protein Rec8/ScpA/Scc1 (kleisin family)